jgi:hypothetical protein
MKRVPATLAALACLAACHGPDRAAQWLEAVIDVPVPATAGSRYPNLAPLLPRGAVMSWLEPGADGAFALRQATWNAGAWTAPGTVAAGSDWFINWADFPSVVPVAGRTWAAHWLQQKPGDVYSYDVRIAVSQDAGETWSQPMSPHDDGTPTEHGFVSLVGDGDSARAVWLDGRQTSGEHDHSGGSGNGDSGGGAMTLRSALVGPDGLKLGPDVELDARTCDCCQTDSARTREGLVVVYRDRSETEIRDIALLRQTAAGWSDPVPVARDGWLIDACPVNGPAVDARGDTVVVAWFTAADKPRVRLAFSADGGRTFRDPVEVAAGKVAGRVDVALLPDGRAVVSWLEDATGSAEIRAQPFTEEGPAGTVAVIARSEVARSSGFPQMALVDGALLFAWTRPGDPPQVQAALARLR